MLLNFTGKRDKHEHFFSVEVEEELAEQLQLQTRITREESGDDKKKEIPSIFKRVVLDAFQHINEEQEDVWIKIQAINDGNVTYIIDEEEEHPVHQIALQHFNQDDVINEVVKHRIVTVQQLIKTAGAETVLEHFSEIKRKSPGIFSRVLAAIGHFFSWLLLRFRFIEFLWEAITHHSEKKEARM